MQGARCQLKDAVRPVSSLIGEAGVYVTRRPGDVLMARAYVTAAKAHAHLELLLVCEAYKNGSWVQTETCRAETENDRWLTCCHPFACEPSALHRFFVFAFAGSAERPRDRQHVCLQIGGVWNIRGRDDGLDEPKETPLAYDYR